MTTSRGYVREHIRQALAHEPKLLVKQGSEWTNDLGQTFPAVPLYRAECSCGWHGQAWYSTTARALGHYERHLPA